MSEKEENKVIVIISYGRNARVCVDGKVFGMGITEINFSQKAGEEGKLSAICNILPIVGDGSDEAIDSFINTATSLCKRPDAVDELIIHELENAEAAANDK